MNKIAETSISWDSQQEMCTTIPVGVIYAYLFRKKKSKLVEPDSKTVFCYLSFTNCDEDFILLSLAKVTCKLYKLVSNADRAKKPPPVYKC